ncbi:GIN domain-containing protein [Chryseobacterium indoltheticum]|uniref:GIN domain-containing protein n=1 Tax=Chryseobacterium indoltheticum TaxID=254 RepID=UPI003F49B3B3
MNYKQENTSNVKVLADADKLKHVITKVENGVLKVYIDNKGVKNLKFKNLTVNVSSPKMNMIKALYRCYIYYCEYLKRK